MLWIKEETWENDTEMLEGQWKGMRKENEETRESKDF